MKQVKITQCSVGKFNLFGNEKSLSFYAGIYENDKLIERDGNKAQIHYSGEPDEEYKFENLDNLEEIIKMCFDYSARVISSTDYEGNTLLFIEMYNSLYSEINEYHALKREQEIKKQIEELQKELASGYEMPEVSWQTNNILNKQVAMYNKWVESSEKKILEYKEGSESHTKELKRITKYKSKIEKYQSLLIPA